MEKEARAAPCTPCFFTLVSRRWKLSAMPLNASEVSLTAPEPVHAFLCVIAPLLTALLVRPADHRGVITES